MSELGLSAVKGKKCPSKLCAYDDMDAEMDFASRKGVDPYGLRVFFSISPLSSPTETKKGRGPSLQGLVAHV